MNRQLPSLQIQTISRQALLCVLFAVSLDHGANAQQSWVADKLQQDDAPTIAEGEELSGRPDREIRLSRDAQITRGESVLNANDVYYDIVDDRVDADGNVRILRSGDRFQGTLLKLKMDTGVGYMDSPVYRLLRRNAHGYAKRVDFESEDVATIFDGLYTTCNGPDPDWYLKTKRLTLDEGTGIGDARNAVLVFKGVPIGGAPMVTFPLNDSRQSGFLAPTIATSSNTGLQVTTPYFWNIAPNRDLTLYPRYMSNRGLMLGADARYLEQDYKGETRLEFMNDSEYPTSLRFAISAHHDQALAPGVGLAIDVNRASDDNYARDFPFSHVFERPGINRRLLPQTATVSYNEGGEWFGSVKLSDFQTLQDSNGTYITQPYARLPQVNLNYASETDSGLSLGVASQFTYFAHPTEVQGERLVINPRATYDLLQGPGYFFRPSVSVHGTLYNLERDALSSTTRVLPSMSLDTGLVFERETSFFGRDAVQTLEPRAFYTYTPYLAQNDGRFPKFDTTIADLSYEMMFRENRFIGNDRIGDSNLVTLAVTSRYLESDGAERLRVAMAQRFNFSQARVGISTDLSASSSTEKSDVLLLTSGRITREVRVNANLQYNQTQNEVNRVNFGVYWQPEPMKVLNAQYRRDSRNLDQTVYPGTDYELVDLSAQWPIASRWYGVGRVNYLLNDHRVGQALVGVEHQADCWIFRFVGQRLPTAAGVVNTALFFQLELNGLSSIGMNPLSALRFNIPGYQPLVPQSNPDQ
jgi:LPS-assembly protein